MVIVNVDANFIDAEPVKDHTDASLIQAYTALWTRLTASKTVAPKLHMLDNEASAAFKAAIKQNCDLQLVPPDTHRRNLAERAIQTFKSHLIAIFAGVDEFFPMQLWDRLIPQAVLTLNLLRKANANPNISAYEYVHGKFDYNKMPLAPMGCEAQIHKKTDKRGTWAYHSLDGWYLNTSPEHYRVHNCHIKSTKAERLTDTIHFKHKNITNPTLSHLDKLMNALANCKAALLGQIAFKSNNTLTELKTLVQHVERKLQADNTTAHTTAQPPQCNTDQPVPRVATQPVPDNTPPPSQPLPRVANPLQSPQQIARRAALQRSAIRCR